MLRKKNPGKQSEQGETYKERNKETKPLYEKKYKKKTINEWNKRKSTIKNKKTVMKWEK